MSTATPTVRASAAAASLTVLPVLFAISFVHMMNDSMQATVPALFTILEKSLHLSYMQLGWLTFGLNMTSSVLQPVVGIYTDRTSKPYLLPFGMALSLLGMVAIALAPSFWVLLLAVVFVGFGSAIFHPEGSRVVWFAAGGKRGFAQSVYQVGGNGGSSLAPLMTMYIFMPLGQIGALWGTVFALAAILTLLWVAPWYKRKLADWNTAGLSKGKSKKSIEGMNLSRGKVLFAMGLLVFLVFGRSWYSAGIGNYYQFYLIDHYGLTAKHAQLPLFLFLLSGVIGTFFGGVLADRIGLKKMIFLSVAGTIPFAIALPHLPLLWAYPFMFIIGLILNSGFSVAVVYAQHLMPTKVGMASGLTTGLAFGMGALGSVVLGAAADHYGMGDMMRTVSYLPLIGLLALLLPSDRKKAS